MAKKVGSDDDEGGRITTGADAAPPPEGHNLTPEEYLTAVKEITAAQAKLKGVQAEYKAVRKKWRSSVALGVLDAMVKMAEWSRGEVRDHFETQRRYAEWLGLPIAPAPAGQGEFRGLDDTEIQRREAMAMGRTASRAGKPGKPPEELDASLHQAWLQGYNEEDEQSWADAETADKREDEDAPAESTAANPTGEADEKAEDQAPEQPSWKGYSPDYKDWFAAQWRDFNTWYDAVPAGATVHISHEGVVKAFRDRRDGKITEAGDPVEAAPAKPPASGKKKGGGKSASVH